MEQRRFKGDYRFRPPRPSRFWSAVLRPVRRWFYRRYYGVTQIEIRGSDCLLEAARPSGALVAVNHPAHGDPFVILEVLDRLGIESCTMAAWQVLEGWFGLKSWAFQRLGAFSVDREGTDLRAFRMAVDVLAKGARSLVIFPEGEVYHLNDQVTPMREGAAMIAMTAARRRHKAQAPPLGIVPCAIKYFYVEDPTSKLESAMARLEERLHWRPRSERALADRVYGYAEAVLGLKECEYLGVEASGPLPERIDRLREHVLGALETRWLGRLESGPVPVRVKTLWQVLLEEIEPPENGSTPAPSRPADRDRDLQDLHFVMQLFSYPGDYVARHPSLERIAETVDKFEEDALGAGVVRARAARRAVVTFGEPLPVVGSGPRRAARGEAAALTGRLEERLQAILTESVIQAA